MLAKLRSRRSSVLKPTFNDQGNHEAKFNTSIPLPENLVTIVKEYLGPRSHDPTSEFPILSDAVVHRSVLNQHDH